MSTVRVVVSTYLVAAARKRSRRARTTSTIAARAERSVQLLFMDACEKAVAAVDLPRVEAALRPPISHDELEAALSEGIAAFDAAMREPLAAILATVYLQTRTWAAESLGQIEPESSAVLAASADPRMDAVRWALERAAAMVGIITDDLRAAIQQLTLAAFRDGLPAEELTRIVFAQVIVGLTVVQVTSVLAAFRRLRVARPGASVDIGARRVRVPAAGWRAGEVAEHVIRYARRQRAARGLVIARTETVTAANAGQHALWMRAVRANWLPPGARRRWVVAPSACPRCAFISGQVVGLTEPFRGPDGPILYPPAHPSCRCAVVLES